MGTSSIGPIEDIMEILHVVNCTEHIGKLYIHNIRRLDKQINDKCTTKPNILFDVIIMNSTDRGHQ